eukprot:TRINITY_DN788_c1_g1_i1.p2 TRINITY_DN788_c1_g1~~TRINITY_DN788_c1_g1_i1.p2  ORF type:complete len:235 (-),score=47.99 TRINITY_DN788_c1_g1_i1:6-683(-)
MAYTVDVKNVYSLLDNEREEPQLVPLSLKPTKQTSPQINSVVEEFSVKDDDFLPVGKRGVGVDSRRGRAGQGLGKGRRGRVRGVEGGQLQVDAGQISGEGGYSYGPSPQQHDENRIFNNGRGRGRGRGGRRLEFDIRGKREFDRSDGTGRGHETEKRAGSGRGNWGRQGDEYEQIVTEGETEDERIEETQTSGEQLQMNGIKDESIKEEAEMAPYKKYERNNDHP